MREKFFSFLKIKCETVLSVRTGGFSGRVFWEGFLGGFYGSFF
jgi:hypothetical protein